MVDTIRRGDLLAHVEHVGQGELTVCGVSFPGDLLDPAIQERMQAHLSELTIACKQIGPDKEVVLLAVPPQQRLE